MLNQDWAEPLRAEEAADQAAAQRRREFQLAWFADPLFYGEYPASMRRLVGERLPTFTELQRQRLRGSLDFLGINHYSTRYYSWNDTTTTTTTATSSSSSSTSSSPSPFGGSTERGWSFDLQATPSKFDRFGKLIGPQGESEWLNDVPWGFYSVLHWIHERYYSTSAVQTYDWLGAAAESPAEGDDGGDGKRAGGVSGISSPSPLPPPLYVTENGCDAPGESFMPLAEALNDQFR